MVCVSSDDVVLLPVVLSVTEPVSVGVAVPRECVLVPDSVVLTVAESVSVTSWVSDALAVALFVRSSVTEDDGVVVLVSVPVWAADGESVGVLGVRDGVKRTVRDWVSEGDTVELRVPAPCTPCHGSGTTQRATRAARRNRAPGLTEPVLLLLLSVAVLADRRQEATARCGCDRHTKFPTLRAMLVPHRSFVA